jgi:hypothetical protein
MDNITDDHINVLRDALETWVQLGEKTQKELDCVDEIWYLVYESYLQGAKNVWKTEERQ